MPSVCRQIDELVLALHVKTWQAFTYHRYLVGFFHLSVPFYFIFIFLLQQTYNAGFYQNSPQLVISLHSRMNCYQIFQHLRYFPLLQLVLALAAISPFCGLIHRNSYCGFIICSDVVQFLLPRGNCLHQIFNTRPFELQTK